MPVTRKILACAAALAVTIATAAHAERPPGPPPGAAQGPSAKPPGYRARKFSGGQGASWKTGRDAYGFQGAYGGCQYRGHAGPRGYRLDKAC